MLPVLNRLVDLLGGLLFAVVATAIFVSMVATTADVIAIRVYSTTVRGAVEFATNLMPVIVFGSLAYIQRYGQHIRVELIYDRCGPRVQAALDALNAVVVTFAAAALAIVSWQGYLRSNAIKEAGMAFRFPIYPVKLFIVIGFSVMVLKMLTEILNAVDRIRHPTAASSSIDRVLQESAVALGPAAD
jgi:TRAP-type mannitol/chloroaromatic compound transport system permease small subunit